MRNLSKYHIYTLFLLKESCDTLIFKNPRKFSILISLAVTLMFFSIYVLFVHDMPESDPDKKYLVYFTLGLGSIGALMVLKFISTSETLTIRKPMNSITYEYRTLTGVKGWKRQISDFTHLNAKTSIIDKSGGVYIGNDSHWMFDLVAKDGFKVPISPKSIVVINAKYKEKALAFSKKISDFMAIEMKFLK